MLANNDFTSSNPFGAFQQRKSQRLRGLLFHDLAVPFLVWYAPIHDSRFSEHLCSICSSRKGWQCTKGKDSRYYPMTPHRLFQHLDVMFFMCVHGVEKLHRQSVSSTGSNTSSNVSASASKKRRRRRHRRYVFKSNNEIRKIEALI